MGGVKKYFLMIIEYEKDWVLTKFIGEKILQVFFT